MNTCNYCDIKFDCECTNGKNKTLKYRSCALINKYPRSQLNFEGELIHLCSKECDAQYGNEQLQNYKLT